MDRFGNFHLFVGPAAELLGYNRDITTRLYDLFTCP